MARNCPTSIDDGSEQVPFGAPPGTRTVRFLFGSFERLTHLVDGWSFALALQQVRPDGVEHHPFIRPGTNDLGCHFQDQLSVLESEFLAV